MPRLRWLTLIVVAFAAHAAAEIYRWTDAEGKVHYSDAPPASGKGKAEQVKLPPVSSIRGPATVSGVHDGQRDPDSRARCGTAGRALRPGRESCFVSRGYGGRLSRGTLQHQRLDTE